MIRVMTILSLTVFAIAAWVVLVFMGFNEGWGRSAITSSDDTADFTAAAQSIIEQEHMGNISMVILEDGEVVDRYNHSTGKPVDGSSIFQVASLGKWITAWGVMVLVEDGVLELDRPVSEYLTRWQLPSSEFDASGVTVRRLLSHTAGLSDGLGYDGFDGPEDVQSLEDSLTRAGDASPGNDGVVQLGAQPGSGWNYSGGGYTLLQLLIEEVSGQSFAAFMTERVFGPLGMERSTFVYEDAADLGLTENFDLDGETEPFRWYTALAATSLFTTADDLAAFLSLQSIEQGQAVLSSKALATMRTPHAAQMGADIWGLGVMLFAPNNRGGYVIGHDGSNGPAINTAARYDPYTGDGIVILSTGSEILATEIASEWVYWKTGNVDSLMFLMTIETMLLVMVVGAAVILILGIVALVRRRRV